MASCLEIKHTLANTTKIYACEELWYEPGFGMLRYVIDREYDIQGHALAPGDVTHALYWEDRPYTLYVWDVKKHGRLFYFNIADRIGLRPGTFMWRDLALDVLITAEGKVEVLDEHELPGNLDRDLRAYINSAVNLVTSRYREIMQEAEELISRYGKGV